ncbi:hypothetical protein CPB85DRAFT_428049 [Mucidula mucida]|nr:hypothetical protein CPB85DRAFT_428049 [Mucidula mucida]
MPVDFPNFLLQLNDTINAENGENLAYLLRPTSPHGKDLVKQFKNATKSTFSNYLGSIQSPWDEIAVQYVLVCLHVARRRPMEAFKEHTTLVGLFYRFFTENRGWTLLALFSILRDLRDLAFDSDIYAKESDLKSDSMEDAARTITKAFGLCMTDRISPFDQSRKWGVYYVVGLVLKCYFRIKRISLSKSILRALDANNDIPPLQQYPRSHQVTYRYYIGMLKFLSEDYAKSEEELTLAFYQCHIEAHANQERILTYLIPLRMLKGHLPSDELMTRFPDLENLYRSFIKAIRTGDIASYDHALDLHEKKLLDLNLYITLEKARESCLRSLFRRVWVVADKQSRLPISMFHSALKTCKLDVDAEEAECLLANLIYKGYIRGYISHAMQMVVLANMNAFPRVADRPEPYKELL